MSRFISSQIDDGISANKNTTPKDLEDKMRVIANLIIDRILEDQTKGKIKIKSKTMLKSN